jgi:hypothetical protein
MDALPGAPIEVEQRVVADHYRVSVARLAAMRWPWRATLFATGCWWFAGFRSTCVRGC